MDSAPKKTNQEKCVIVGAGEFQLPLIRRARELGYETHVFAWGEVMVGRSHADHFYPVAITQKDLILSLCRDLQPACVVSIASDVAARTANYVSRALGLPANPEFTDLTSTNKYLMREAFKQHGIAVPNFVLVDTDKAEEIVHSIESAGLCYPLIVKPTDRSSSIAVSKVANAEELVAALQVALTASVEGKAIVEEFISGAEYSCECISHAGKHHLVAFTQKFTTGEPYYLETGHLMPANFNSAEQDYLASCVFECLDALRIKTGASHIEFKITPSGEFRVIETAARMAGDYIGSDLVELATGYDYSKAVIDVAQGLPPETVPTNAQTYALARFMYSKDELEDLKRLKQENPNILVSESWSSPNDSQSKKSIASPPRRLGYFIISNHNLEEILQYTPTLYIN